jgi:MFS superfamily sulfate permease-like transporter
MIKEIILGILIYLLATNSIPTLNTIPYLSIFCLAALIYLAMVGLFLGKLIKTSLNWLKYIIMMVLLIVFFTVPTMEFWAGIILMILAIIGLRR